MDESDLPNLDPNHISDFTPARAATMSATAVATRSFSDAHRLYVKSLYRRYLVNTLNWAVRRDLWREKALEVRAEFERHRLVPHNTRDLAVTREEGPW